MSQPGGPYDTGKSGASGSASLYGGTPAGEGKSTAQKAGEQARHEAEKFSEQAKERVRSLAEERKSVAADQVHGFADALHKASEGFRNENYATIGEYADEAARRIDDFAQRLRQKDVDSLMSDITGFARRQPVLFLGGAVALGFALSRFFKASSDQYSRYEGYRYRDDFDEGHGSAYTTGSSYASGYTPGTSERPIPSTTTSGSGGTTTPSGTSSSGTTTGAGLGTTGTASTSGSSSTTSSASPASTTKTTTTKTSSSTVTGKNTPSTSGGTNGNQ